MENYFLLHKHTIVTALAFDESGRLMHAATPKEPDLAPLKYRYRPTWIRDWWEERAVPFTQDRIPEFLNSNGYDSVNDYLIKNLGLSLTDHYWVKPVDSDLTWEQVNLYTNDFKKNAFFFNEHITPAEEGEPLNYSPNGSLQGDIEKTWAIQNGERYLIKGNRSNLSSESINEIIATELHKRQNKMNYATYSLLKIKGKPYDYGCCCKSVTSDKTELLHLWDIYSSAKRPNHITPYEFAISQCKQLGMDEMQIRHELEYIIMSDFVLSGYDRHLNNIAVLRDSDTLQYQSLAPVYDSGSCLFANKQKPHEKKQLLKIKINSFTETEQAQLDLVKDKNCLDLSKLPPVSFIKEKYGLDSQIREEDINAIAYGYEKKIDLCRSIQLGRDPWKKQYSIYGIKNSIAEELEEDEPQL